MVEALPAVGTAQQDAGKGRYDAPPDGGQARPGLGWGTGAFFPEAEVLEEGEGELAQEHVVVQAAPAPTLEMVQPQLLLELLVHLLADPARLDQRRQDLERCVGRMVRQVVLALAGGAVLADEPGFCARQVLRSGHHRPVGHAYPERGEPGLERALSANPPGDGTKQLRPCLEQL